MSSNLFVIDTSSSDEQRLNVPQYQIGRKSVELIQQEEKSTPKFRNQQNNLHHCWNCGKKNHSIRECGAEYNQISVEWNRALQSISKEYEAKKFQKSRYHQTDKSSEKFTLMKEGIISHKLRQVLGLSDGELPSYIYRLRAHGYPKAWLKHATVKPSGINLYDAHGNEVADPDAEDGEILEEEDKIKYDLDKLIQFPGFNSPMPENSADDYEKMKSPPFSEDQSLENMIKQLKEKAVSEYCLKKNTSSSSVVLNSSQNTDDNMEIEESISQSEEVSSFVNGFIPSLPNDEIRPTTPPLDDSVSSCSQTDSECILNSISQDSKSTASSQNGLGRILSSSEGTPLLKSKSGHSRLPPPENFSKDICDVINFENLPESTGKFEKMRNLLKKVKKILDIKRQNS